MPTIPQLPAAATVDPSDEIPVSQGGVVRSVTLGTLLASTQPAIMAESGTLLGRVSLGPGGPESIAVGEGLVLQASTLQATSPIYTNLAAATGLVGTDSVLITSGGGNPRLMELDRLRGLFSAGSNVAITASGVISAATPAGTTSTPPLTIAGLPPATAPTALDLIGISQGGSDHAIAYTNLISGQTIDSAQPATPATDGDSFWVAQGSNTMARQTFSAVWPWIGGKLVTFKTPVVELTTNTTLDGTTHNARVLVCSQPVTLTPIAINMGSGFFCEIINVSAGSVSFAGSVILSSGTASLAPGQGATLRCLTYSGGTIVYAFVGNGGTVSVVPGAVGGLSAGSPTSSSLQLTWQVPSSGGLPTSYSLLSRNAGTTTWTGSIAGIIGTSKTVTGLSGGTNYEFSIYAVNASGSGPSSPVVAASTAVPAGAVTSIVWNAAPVGSYTHASGVIGINVHVSPATAAVQFGFSTSVSTAPSSWTPGGYVNTDLWGAYVAPPPSAGTWYAWAAGTDGSAPTAYTTAFTVT